ncbi:MAG TPA: hypothetical protein VFE32_17260 [Puia sp.]|nr:hypothetical protein [Puia sp.]
MNQLTERLTKTFQPRLAIIAYTSMMDDWGDAYLESHEIDDQGALLEAKPLKQETIQGMIDVFFDDRQNRIAISGLLPPNILFYEGLPGGHYAMIWHRPAERRRLFFEKSLHIANGEAFVPPMLYKASRRELAVYALPDDRRPDEKTALLRAPFHNVGEEGDVCLGSAMVPKPKERTYAALMKYWEDLFWLSEFSHLQGSKSPTRTNINLLWPKLIKNKRLTWAELDELQPIGKKTVKDIL